MGPMVHNRSKRGLRDAAIPCCVVFSTPSQFLPSRRHPPWSGEHVFSAGALGRSYIVFNVDTASAYCSLEWESPSIMPFAIPSISALLRYTSFSASDKDGWSWTEIRNCSQNVNQLISCQSKVGTSNTPFTLAFSTRVDTGYLQCERYPIRAEPCQPSSLCNTRLTRVNTGCVRNVTQPCSESMLRMRKLTRVRDSSLLLDAVRV